MIGSSDLRNWLGKTLHVVQLRGGERVWSGTVTANRAFGCGFGMRSSGEEYGQWQAGDTIVNGCNSSALGWRLEDSIQLGGKFSMFDYTVPRLEYSSVTRALEALNADASRCEEGVCIVRTSSQDEYILLIRQDHQHLFFSMYSSGLSQHQDLPPSSQKVQDMPLKGNICDPSTLSVKRRRLLENHVPEHGPKRARRSRCITL